MIEAVIRPMAMDDLAQVVALEESCFSLPWSWAAFESELLDNTLAHYFVVQSQDKIVGYAGMWIIIDEAHITNVAVLADYRQQGLGKLLLTNLITTAKSLGADCMTLEVRVHNETAQRLYRQFGFETRGVRHHYYSDTFEDALIMWRDKLD